MPGERTGRRSGQGSVKKGDERGNEKGNERGVKPSGRESVLRTAQARKGTARRAAGFRACGSVDRSVVSTVGSHARCAECAARKPLADMPRFDDDDDNDGLLLRGGLAGSICHNGGLRMYSYG